jgi:hypothetical protein
MQNHESQKFLEKMDEVFSLWNGITIEKKRVWWTVLKEYQLADISDAFIKHVKRSKFEPKPADIIELIEERFESMWLTPDEAWAIAKQLLDEQNTVQLTDAIHAAMTVVYPLSDDMIAARMAFKSAYERVKREWKDLGRLPKFEVSLGHDKAMRADVVANMANAGLLTSTHATVCLPTQDFNQNAIALVAKAGGTALLEGAKGGVEPLEDEPVDALANLSAIKELLKKPSAIESAATAKQREVAEKAKARIKYISELSGRPEAELVSLTSTELAMIESEHKGI